MLQNLLWCHEIWLDIGEFIVQRNPLAGWGLDLWTGSKKLETEGYVMGESACVDNIQGKFSHVTTPVKQTIKTMFYIFKTTSNVEIFQ